MVVLLQIIAVTIFLFLVQEAIRRANRWAVWGLFLVVPLLLTPYWIRVNDLGPFPWFKFYTVFSCVCWGVALRTTAPGKHNWARATIPLLLAVNIFEAVVLDLVGKGPAHTFNAAAGLLLIATLPYGNGSVQIDSMSRYRDLLYHLGRHWVTGYTLWNWTFVYLNFPALTGHHTAVLAAGWMVGMLAPSRWVQARSATLGVNLLFTATSFNGMIAWLDTTHWFHEQLASLAAGLALVYIVVAVGLPLVHSLGIDALFPRRKFALRLPELGLFRSALRLTQDLG